MNSTVKRELKLDWASGLVKSLEDELSQERDDVRDSLGEDWANDVYLGFVLDALDALRGRGEMKLETETERDGDGAGRRRQAGHAETHDPPRAAVRRRERCQRPEAQDHQGQLAAGASRGPARSLCGGWAGP